MANNRLIVDERQRDLGNFMVGRLLPFRQKRQVGPFTFIDHMGPSKIGPEKYLDIDQHPHIGLSTLTYLISGAIHHKDSMGSDQIIYPGDVGFMTSGKGVTHTERTPENMRRGQNHMVQGYQIWVALPEELEYMEPVFQYLKSTEVPEWVELDCKIRLVAGKAFGRKSKIEGYSEMFMLDVLALNDTVISLEEKLRGEVAFVVVKGEIEIDGESIQKGQMLISKTNEMCSLDITKGTQVLLFGGKPLAKEPLLLWNFVSSDKERLKQAKQYWINRKFPVVPSDSTYKPFPNT